MMLQAYIDESADGGRFVMAGYIASPEVWAKFSEEWEEILPLAVPDRLGEYEFKMREIAALDERMDRVPAFYRVIERNLALAVSVTLELDHLSSDVSRISVNGNNILPGKYSLDWILSFRMLMDFLHKARSNLSPSLSQFDVIDFYFDERTEKTPVMASWGTMVSNMPPEIRGILGKPPVSATANEFFRSKQQTFGHGGFVNGQMTLAQAK